MLFAQDILGSMPAGPAAAPATQGFDAFGDILQPSKGAGGQSAGGHAPPVPPPPAGPIITGDLDSSIASLAQNLDINGPKGQNYKK